MKISTNANFNAVTTSNRKISIPVMSSSLRWLFVFLLFITTGVNAQLITNYAHSSNTNGSLILDMNSNAIDMSTGTTNLFTGYHDDDAGAIVSLPFNVVFLATGYDRFSVNSNGQVRLGSLAVSPVLTGAGLTVPASGSALLAPLTGDNNIQSNGKIHYKVFGSAPNRVFVIEWLNMRVPFLETDATPSTFQVRIYETTNVIEYIYGSMFQNAASAQSRSIGLGAANLATLNTYIATITTTPTNTAATSWTTTSFGAASSMTNLNSLSDGSRRFFRWTPPVVAINGPSSLSFSNVGSGSMTLTWAPPGTQTGIQGYTAYASTDGGVTYNIAAGSVLGSTSTSMTVNNLTPGTTYLWKVYAVNEGGLSSTSADAVQATNGCSMGNVTRSVGPGGDYATLTAALDAVKLAGLNGPVILELKTDYVSTGETFPIALTAVTCASPTNTITIRPVSGATNRVISSNNTTATISIDGGNYYVIDGRPGGSGTSRQLTIANTSTTTGGRALFFQNEGSNNIFRYDTLRSTFNSTAVGVVSFGATTGANGNDNNTIDNCAIDGNAGTAASPTTTAVNGIYNAGLAVFTNSGNTISNNSIFNCFAAATASNGINLSSNADNWTINGNSIYQTNARVATTGLTSTGILLNAATINGITVSGNYIGGSAPLTAGTWTQSGTIALRFRGISVGTGTGTACSITGNTIANISQSTNTAATTVGGPWVGIYLTSTSTTANPVIVSGNTIGSATGNGSISLTQVTSAAGLSNGIYIDAGVNTITNNVIGSINLLGTATISNNFTGINIASSVTTTNTITGNTIGSTSTTNSINMNTGYTGSTAQVLTGIANINTNAVNVAVIANNTIANLTNSYAPAAANTSSFLRGIFATNGLDSIVGNTVRNLTAAGNGTGTGAGASVIGIGNSSATVGNSYISRNTVHSLSNTHATAVTYVTGIYAGTTGTAMFVERNLVHSLTATSTSALVNGINAGATGTFRNNMVRLGLDAAGASITTSTGFNGFLETAGANTIQHNTIYIGGTAVATTVVNTHAFFNNVSLSTTRDIRNNIFLNVRSNTSTGGKHYAIRTTGSTPIPNLTLNYNIYNATGTGGVFGSNNGADVADIAAWRTALGLDLNSMQTTPALANAANADLHLAGTSNPADGVGFNTGLVDDYDGETRATLTPTDIGADAGNYGVVGVDVGISGLAAPAPPSGCYTANEAVTVNLVNFGVTTINFSVNPVFISVTATGGYSSNITINSGTLASNATLPVTLPATINLTQRGSYTFNMSATASGDVNTANDAATIVYNYFSLGGSYNVGTGGQFTTLTSAIAAYNAATCFTGPVTFNLTNTTYNTASGETFPYVINANSFAGSNTLTIRPAAGTAVAITGTSGASVSSLIKLNGADRIIIDGINSGGASLSIENTSTTSGTVVIWLASLGAGQGATNNIIRNTTLRAGIAQPASATVSSGIIVAGNTISATFTLITAGDDNDNNIIENNTILKVRNAIYFRGGSSSNPNTGTQILNNIIGPATAGTDNIGRLGINVREEDGVIISGNEIRGMGGAYATATSGTDRIGIAAASDLWPASPVYLKNAVITRNRIHDLIDERTSTTGYSAIAISLAGADGANATNNLVANNMIYNNRSIGQGPNEQTLGIGITAGKGDKVVYNSIYLSGDVDPDPASVGQVNSNFGISIASNFVEDVTIKNNIVQMDLRSSSAPTIKNACINIPASYAWGTGSSDYNDFYFVSPNDQSNIGCIGGSGGTFYNSLSAWQTASSQDANSLQVAPAFTSATDLHLLQFENVALDNKATPIAGVTTDYDSDVRNVSTPDMGMDEFSTPVGVNMASVALLAPDTSGCYTTTETVTVRIRNKGIATIDYSVNPVTVTVTATGGYSQNVVLSSGTLAPLATQDVSMPVTIDMTTPGAYVFNVSTNVAGDIQTSNDALAPITRTSVAPTVGTVNVSSPTSAIYCVVSGRPVLELSSAAGGTIQWQESTSSNTGPWTNVGTDSLRYTVATDITATTYYRALVSCAAISSVSNVVTVTYNNPQVTGTTPGSRCGVGTVVLQATGSAGTNLNWYDVSTGGTVLGTGTSFTTPSISVSTNYYVSASIGGTSSFISKAAPEAGSVGTVLSTYGQDFTVTTGFDLNTVQVYSTTGTSITISLYSAGGTTQLHTTGAVTVPTNTTSTITLGWNIAPGTYRLCANGMTGNFIRDNSGVTYPFALGTVGTMNGFVSSITGTVTTSASYYFMYNWGISTGCESARTMVTATVNTAPPLTSASASPAAICAGSSSTLTATSANPNYTYVWTPGNLANGATVSPTTTTTYTVTATDNVTNPGTPCVVSDIATLTVNPAPSNVVMTPSAPIACVGASVSLTATSGQNVTDTIGKPWNGTTQLNTTGSPYRSGGGANWFIKSQYLILASEMQALGFQAGSITDIGFQLSQVTATTTLHDFSIRMGHTAVSALSSTFETSASTLVFSQALLTTELRTLGPINHHFSTPFVWNGTSNIVVQICQQNDASTTTTGVGSMVTSPAFAGTSYAGSATVDCITTTAATTSTTRPIIYIKANTTAPITWSPNTYLNTTSGNTVISTPLAPITYTATATLGSCIKTNTVTVTLSNLAVSAVHTDAICNGSSTGTITATATGGTAPYTYSINGTTFQSSNVFGAVAAGTYTIYVKDSNTPSNCTVAGNTVTVTQPPALTSTIAAYTNPTCHASSLNNSTDGSITAVGGGGTGSYTYTINGPTVNNSGATSGIFTGLSSGSYTVTVTDFNNCQTTSTAQVLTSPAAPSVSAGNNGPICAGSNATLTATPGTYSSYAWTGPGTINNANTAVATAVTPANNEVFTVLITDNLGCTNTASTTVSVTANTTVSVSLSVAPSNEVCANSTVTFTATPTNGGAIPNYEFFVNAVSVQNGLSDTYITSTLADQDVVTVVMTSAITCASGNPATSNAITMTVSSNVFAAVSLTASPSTTVCSGTSITYTATPTAGGPAPTYDFYVNNVSMQNSASATYIYAPANGDEIYVIMTSSFDCALGNPTTSASIFASVNPIPAAPVVTPSGSTTFCNGGAVTLTSDNPGTGNQWYLDGNILTGETNPTLTVSAAGSYTVVYTALGCSSAPSVPVVIIVNANPVATISGSPVFCTGSTATLSAATSTAGSGTIAGYQWVRNGTTNLGTAVTEVVNVVGSYTVIVTNSNGCSTTSAAATVTEVPPIVAGITSSCTTIYPNQSLSLTATPTTGATYAWTLNGGPVLSTSNPFITPAGATGTFQVTVTDIASSCFDTETITITDASGPLAGGSTYTIPAGCGGFPTIASAVSYLNTYGISGVGTVIFNVSTGHTETAPTGGIVLNMCALDGSLQPDVSKPVIFQRTGTGANPLITAAIGTGTQDVIVGMVGADYLTMDGIDLRANPSATTGTQMPEWGYLLTGCSGTDGAQHNTIKNCTITLNKTNGSTHAGIAILNAAPTTIPITALSGTNSYNRILNNTVTNALNGIRLFGYDHTVIPYSFYDQENEIRNNTVTNFGRGTSSATSNGIYAERNNNIKITDNNLNSAGGLTHIGSLTGIGVSYARWANAEVRRNTVTLVSNPGGINTSGMAGISVTAGNRTYYNRADAPANSIVIDSNIIQNCNLQSGKGFFRMIQYNKFDTLGAYSVNITNNQILNNSSSADTASGFVFQGIMSQPTANVYNVSNNIISGNNWTGPSATAAHPRMIVLTMGWEIPTADNFVTTKNITGNRIINNSTTSTTGPVTGIVLEGGVVGAGTLGSGSVANISDNYVGDVTLPTITGTFSGIVVSSGVSGNNVAFAMHNDTVANINRNAATTGAFDGVRQLGTPKSVIMNGNRVTGFSMTGATTAAVNAVTSTGSSSLTDTLAMNNNVISGNTQNGTGIFTCINGGLTAGGATINNNVVSNNQKTGASGTFEGVTFTGSSTLTDSLSMSDNLVTGNTLAGTGTMTCMDGGLAVAMTMNNNTVTYNQKTGASGSLFSLRASTSKVTYNGNTINHNSIPAASGATAAIVYGIYNLGAPTVENITNNNIDSLSIGGTNTATGSLVFGIHTSTTASSIKTITGNTIHGLSMASPGNVVGISQALGTSNIFKNKIYNLSSSAASATAFVDGIRVTSGTTANIYNNLIGDLRSTAATADNMVRGIASTSTTAPSTLNLSYNSIYLNASGGTNFGTSGIFHTYNATATTAALTMRNNIIVNTSTPSGTGKTVAFRRSAPTDLNNYLSASNNNLLYAGTPGAKNLIYYAGPSVNDSLLTLAAFKARVTPRETSSVTEMPPFLSTTGSSADFLHINTTVVTQVEAGAENISGITDDFDGNIRQGNPGYTGASTSKPDIGADEMDGTPPPCSSATGGTISPASVAICTSNTATTLTALGATNSGGITYQWMVSATSGSGYVNVTGGSGAATTAYTTPAGMAVGIYYYVLQVTCSNGPVTGLSNEVAVQVKATPTASASNSGPVCSGTPLTLTGTTDIGTSFTWSGPLGYSSTSQSPTFTAPVSGSGTYTFTATFNGCSATATTNVTINTTPTAFITPASVSLCEGSIATLTAGGANGSGLIGTGSAANAANSTPYKGTFGGHKAQFLYTAAELTAIGLTAGNSITNIGVPISAFTGPHTFNDFTIKMKNTSSTSLTATFETGATTVSGPAAFTMSGTAPFTTSHPVTPFTWDGISNLLVEFCYNNNDAGGATGTSANATSTSVTGLTNFLSADNNPTLCAATSGAANTLRININLTYGTPPYPVTWSPSTGLYTNPGATTPYAGQNLTTVYAKPTTSTVYTVTSTNGSCSASATSSVTVKPLPSGASISGTSSVCQGAAAPLITFSANVGTAPYTFTYNINGGSNLTVTTGSGSNPQSVTVAVPAITPGTYVYNLVSVTDALCSNTASGSATVTVNPLPTAPTGTDVTVCYDALPHTGSATAPSGSSVVWYTASTGGSLTTAPSGTAAGTYTAYAASKNDITGCESATRTLVTVTINALPVVSFSGLAGPYCTTDAAVTLTGSPVGGTFSGPGITGNSFDPATAGAGVHTITYTYSNGTCSNTATQNVTVNVCATGVTVNLKLFLQGYYIDGGIMQSVLLNQAAGASATETDNVTIELHDATTFALIESQPALLMTNGLASASFTTTTGSYYIAVKHRNTLQTWTANPVSCTASTPLYDFSNAITKAFGDNQVLLQTGIWGMMTGDLNQDDYIDGNDFPQYDFESASGGLYDGTYTVTDMNGDGFVDGNDFPVYDGNSSISASAIYPQ